MQTAAAKIAWTLHPDTDRWVIVAKIEGGPYQGARLAILTSPDGSRLPDGRPAPYIDDRVQVTFCPGDHFCTVV